MLLFLLQGYSIRLLSRRWGWELGRDTLKVLLDDCMTAGNVNLKGSQLIGQMISLLAR